LTFDQWTAKNGGTKVYNYYFRVVNPRDKDDKWSDLYTASIAVCGDESVNTSKDLPIPFNFIYDGVADPLTITNSVPMSEYQKWFKVTGNQGCVVNKFSIVKKKGKGFKAADFGTPENANVDIKKNNLSLFLKTKDVFNNEFYL